MINNLLTLAHISDFTTQTEPIKPSTKTTPAHATPTKTSAQLTPARTLYFTPDQKVFLVTHKNTFELRTDLKLSHLLQSKYETVMQSRYFGKGGIEIVPSPQLPDSDLADLIRLSYNLTTSSHN